MLDLSKEKSIGFLKKANTFLQEQVLALKKEILLLKQEKAIEEEISKGLSEELLLLKKKFFDKSGEQRKGKDVKKNKKSSDLLPHNQNPLGDLKTKPIVLTTEEEIHRLVDLICKYCQSANIKKMEGCFEESIVVEVLESKYILKKHLQEKWVCSDCNKITTAKGALKLIPGGKFSIQLAVAIVDDKFNNHLPLERQRKIFARNGLYVDVKTLFGLTDHIERLLSSIPAMIRDDVLSQEAVNIDESPMSIFLPKKKKGYIWSISNNYGVYYQYEQTRSGDVAKEMLEGFSGAVIADGYNGYNFLFSMKKITFAQCWSHVRRKFYDAISTNPIAEEMVVLIDELYDIEHKAKDYEDLKILRKLKSSKKIKEIEDWIQKKQGTYLKSSNFGKAMNYIYKGLNPFKLRGKIVNSKHKGSLKEFLTNPYIPIDNNMAERAQRSPVMGRKNFYGFRSLDGADVAMTFYSLIGSCLKLGIVPRVYLLEMSLRALKGECLLTPFQYGKMLQELSGDE